MSTELIGHGWAQEVLRRHLASGSTRHAYLVTGPEGIGRSTLAAWFARALLCSPEPGLERPCGKCEACTLTAKKAHPDLQWKEGDRGLRIDDIRALQHDLSLSPYQATRRVAVMPNFETATTEAGNALLKTLEEPPPNVVLLLTASSEEALLATIVSRCEIIALRPMATADLARSLEARGVSEDRAMTLAAQAMGRPGLALRLAEDDEQSQERSMMVEDGLRLLGMSRAERFEYAADLNRHKEPAENRQASLQVLEAWLGLWREVLHEAHKVESQRVYPEAKLEVEKVAARVESDQVVSTLREIEGAMWRISANANPLLALETVILTLPRVQLA